MTQSYSIEQIIGEVVVKLCKETPPLVDVEGIAGELLEIVSKNKAGSDKSITATRALEFLSKSGVRL